MLTKSALLRAVAVTALVGGMAISSPVLAESATTTSTTTKTTTTKQHGDNFMDVETRVKTLHDKLGITADQEDAWTNVAQAMRDDETSRKALIQERHQNAANMTAVEDLQSFQKIAQAQVDGVGKVISAFEPLYDSMSEDQKKNADEVFGRFEGHRGAPGKANAKVSSSN